MGRASRETAPLNLCCATGAPRGAITIRWIGMFAVRSGAEAVSGGGEHLCYPGFDIRGSDSTAAGRGRIVLSPLRDLRDAALDQGLLRRPGESVA
jgi:hypothetical protein